MRKLNTFILLAVFISAGLLLHAQQTKPIQKATLVVESQPVGVVPSIASQIADGKFKPAENIAKEFNPKKWGKNTAVPGKGLPKGNDPLWDKQTKVTKSPGKAPILTFEAASASATPTDPTGAVGPNHFVNSWNSSFRIFNKSGNPLIPAASLSTIFTGEDDGDPIVMYDRYADRFIITQFAYNGAPYGFLVAICQGPDPVNDGWYTYFFETDAQPDYPKFSVWSDGYYITANKNSSTASTSEVVFAIERDQMITGDPAQMVGFPLTSIVTSGFYSPLGFNCNGIDLPPAGDAPIVYMQDDVWSGVSTDHLKIWNINVNWSSPTSSTISSPQIINTAAFDGLFDNGSFSNIPQPSGYDVDALQATIMYMAQYRRFSGYNSAVFNFVVDLDGNSDYAGIRWYELRQNNDGSPWFIYQEGTYAQPDGHSAFSGNMCMDASGNIALAYTTVSTTIFPSLRYTGRFAGDPLGTMTMNEEVILNGTQVDPFSRYGDYSQMTIDPTDDATFWSIAEVFNSSSRKNHVGVFQFAPPVLTAEFTGSPTNICNSGSVNFTDASLGTPTSWDWGFPGGSPNSYNGQNPPAITYNSSGTYTVSLTVGDGTDISTETKTAYISVLDVIADFSGAPTSIVVGNTVTFTDNSSCGPTSWNWTFPGGTPSSYTGQTPPAIQYDTEGTYDVTLSVTNAAGSDLITRTDYITVSPPEFNMQNGTVTTCEGNFYDSGGPSVDYTSSENLIQTFYPSTPGAMMQFNFTSFETEGTYDFLHIYNGENTSAPLIGSYDGTIGPGTITASNASGAITFNFISDGSVTDPGWSAIISCYSSSTPPVAEFSASITSPAINSDVLFTDLSNNVPTSWSWSFNPSTVVYVNGTSAASQNPEVQFTALGYYTVTLTATNAYGSDAETKTDYINVISYTYCDASGGGDEYISGVQLESINNTGTTSGGYVDYTSLSTDLTLGQTYSITVSNGNVYSTDDLGVWIDWNQNGIFTDAGENVVCEISNGGEGTYAFDVPATATPGSTRMRVRIKYSGTDCGTPCGTTTYGEVEDYTVNVLGGHVTLDLKAYLEGPFNGTDMNADIIAYLPLTQPFDMPIWNYSGTESVGAIPNANVVAWVLVDVRDATNVTTANQATSVAKQAAFLLRDGSIVDMDGSSNLQFDVSISQNMYVVVWQRTHLGIISNNAVTLSGGAYTYDFTTSINQVYGNTAGHKQLSPGVWGMYGGDGNHNGQVEINDKSDAWESAAGEKGYLFGDYNLDGEANNQDKDDVWEPNQNRSSQVPN